jgi:recombinational DNA repair protein (RecF pathway)
MNLDRCCICGRTYRGEGRAVAKREKGGIACLKCEQESALCPGLNPETVRMIQKIRSEPLSKLKRLTFPDAMITELKPALKHHREYHLGQRPKTADCLG